MAHDASSQNDSDLLVTDTPGNRYVDKDRRPDVTLLVSRSKKYAAAGKIIYKRKLAPFIHKSSCCVANEIVKIHSKQNWFKRCSITVIDNAIGLCIGMMAGKVVQSYFEVQQFSNLWGLLASRPVVSETTYEMLSFAVEFFIALIVFTLTEHYLDEYRRRKNSPEIAEN